MTQRLPATSGAGGPWDEASAVRREDGGRAGALPPAATCRHLHDSGAKAFGAACLPRALSGSHGDRCTQTSSERRRRGRESGKMPRRGRTEPLCGAEAWGTAGPSPAAGPGQLTGTGQAQLLQGPPRRP